MIIETNRRTEEQGSTAEELAKRQKEERRSARIVALLLILSGACLGAKWGEKQAQKRTAKCLGVAFNEKPALEGELYDAYCAGRKKQLLK